MIQKLGLNQEFVKKKKTKLSEFQERYPYKCPAFIDGSESQLIKGTARQQVQNLSRYFQFKMEI